jgi:hypothetical protein
MAISQIMHGREELFLIQPMTSYCLTPQRPKARGPTMIGVLLILI